VNNANWEVDAGDTLTISGAVSGNGGVTKNGDGTLILSGSNSYNGSTVVNTGTLTAAHANALGGNTTVQINGGSLLVTVDDALNGKNITLASTANGSAAAAGLTFNGTYNGTAGSLTLSENSTIDLGSGSVALHFSDMVMGLYKLAIYNWTGTTLWNGGNGNNTDQIYFDTALDTNELNRISFYSGITSSSFLGTAFQLSGGSFNQEIIPVPEPETYAAAALLILGYAVHSMWLKRKAGRQHPAKPTA
jgi:autotransporter-associated beta strand protein